jgi:uncharacterized protein (UPF0248 family)
MKYILDVLNQIKWDTRLHASEFTIVYEDRVQDILVEIPYMSIKRIDGTFIVIDNGDEEAFIPLHRIRGIKQEDKVIWKR